MFVLLLFKTVNGQRQNTVSNHKETLSGNVPVKKKKARQQRTRIYILR